MSSSSARDTGPSYVVAVKDSALFGGLLTSIAIAFIATIWHRNKPSKATPTLRGPPILGHWRFFTDRYAFINDGLKKLGSAFQFHILNHTVVAVSGERARSDFLNSSVLSFREGYKVLFGVTPSVRHVKSSFENFESSEASCSHPSSGLRNESYQFCAVTGCKKVRFNVTSGWQRIEQGILPIATLVIPRIFEDIRIRMQDWGTSGKFDPLDDIYDIVFQLTVRASSSIEVADDPALVKNLKHCLHDCEKAASPASMLINWLPSKDRKQRQKSSKEMYRIFKHVLDERRSMGRREDDPTQVLIDEGNSDNDIVEFSMIALFAGVANTGIMAAWVLMYLATSPSWKKKVGDEVQSFISKYAPDYESDSGDVVGNLTAQLSNVPAAVWEDEMELTDLCLRETIRKVQSSVFLRRNVSMEDVDVGGSRVPSGGFVAYPSSDVHHNPAIYESPERFDPSRHIPKGDEKIPPFVGWGAGRHPCLGMRFAKLEVKWIVAMFLAAYEYDVVNQTGTVVAVLPEPNHDNIFDRTKRPEGQALFIRYQRKSGGK